MTGRTLATEKAHKTWLGQGGQGGQGSFSKIAVRAENACEIFLVLFFNLAEAVMKATPRLAATDGILSRITHLTLTTLTTLTDVDKSSAFCGQGSKSSPDHPDRGALKLQPTTEESLLRAATHGALSIPPRWLPQAADISEAASKPLIVGAADRR